MRDNTVYKCVKCGVEYKNYSGMKESRPKQCICGHTLRPKEEYYYPTPTKGQTTSLLFGIGLGVVGFCSIIYGAYLWLR